MFHFYCFNRDEFLKHYHQRSNVEAVFSAVKRKFGDSVRSRNDTAMVNEGIEATFWPDKGEGPRDVLPLVRRG
jgi:transposase